MKPCRSSLVVGHSQNLVLQTTNNARPTTGFYGLHKERDIVLPPFVGTRFQVLFTPLAGVLFTFPSRYWFTIGRKLVFSLAGWSRQFLAGFHVSRDTQEPLEGVWHFHLRGYHPLWPAFPDRSINASSSLVYSVSSLSPGPTPNIVVLQPRALLSNRSVWAFPISLATTFGISVDFSSSGY